MDYTALPAGNNVPEEINAIIEIPKGEGHVKYEYRTNGTLIVDRLRGDDQPLYPVHYCGIPATQSPDGDPLDALILGNDALKSGDVIAVRPVAIFWMTDEKGIDPKIVCVPADSVSDKYLDIRTLEDIPAATRQEIENFFQDYKKNDLEGKWSKSGGWQDIDVAHKVIMESIARWNNRPASVSDAKSQPPKPGTS